MNMKIIVNYHGSFIKKSGKFQDEISFPHADKIAVLYVLLHILQLYDREEKSFFGTRNITLGKEVLVKVNNIQALNVGVEMVDGDIMDLFDPRNFGDGDVCD